MPSECDPIQAVVSILLGRETGDRPDVPEADVESAFRHLKWCRACRSALSTEDRMRFIHSAITERE